MRFLRLLLILVAAVALTAALTSEPLRWYVRGALFAFGLALGAWQISGGRGVLTAGAWLLLWCGLIHLFLRYLALHILRYLEWEPARYGLQWGNRFFLAAHIIGGLTALLLGPWQFWNGLRARQVRLHRWMGRAYVGAVLLAALAAYRLCFRIEPEEGGAAAGLAMAVLATAWLACTALAVGAIWRGAVAAHRRWMVRSYALTLAFINLRWLAELPGLERLGPGPQRVPIIVWTCLVAPLALAELYLRLKPGAAVPAT